jgi:hypothetical protein
MYEIGDTIIMTELANDRYGSTREGSIGEILGYDPRWGIKLNFYN